MVTGTVDRVPLSALPATTSTGWPNPRDISTIEWFASPVDICRVYVLTLNYLATTRTGQSYTVSVLTANPTAPIPATATTQLLGAIKGALILAAG